MLIHRRFITVPFLLNGLELALFVGLSLAGLVLIQPLMPPDLNWTAFNGAGRAVLAMHSPYAVNGFFNPPWSLAIFVPVPLLPSWLGIAALKLISFGSFLYTANRFNRSPLSLFAFALSLPVIQVIQQVNVDGIVLLGLLMPPRYGLFFVTLKPQMGLAVAVFWLFESYRVGRIRQVISDFAPITLVTIGSLLAFGNWMADKTLLRTATWNTSIFPLSVPLGLALMFQSLRTRNLRLALPASPCLSPMLVSLRGR